MNEKTVLITGGASGIGRKTAEILAESGKNVIINYRHSQDKANELVQFLNERFHTNNIAIQGDISQLDDCERLVKKSLEKFPSIDIVIHNAGPYIHERKKVTNYTADEWNYLVNGNLNGVFYLSKLLIPQMRKKGWGRLITFGFDRIETAPGWIFRSAFAAAKVGVASLTRTIALEEAENGITANMVCPGDIIGKWKELSIAEVEGVSDTSSPVSRPGTGEDVGRVISFLCDEKSDFITGAIIPVTGGKDVLGKVYKI
ncbi:SDR family oxidoreductase [Bacillus aquiflavi]|uniref:SDR family oxidoreductase n=1 Tax=Bacillus aquiflavi TaxID=2672567 RepID=A0A6B3W2Q0_9BACI|nr:SDR family oxidoreductase [Bacillus aquiflavi]MBA4537977.1 SDR family oxidoreductase [Bacillus aquiflavi]NEY82233.1 SDR family oxidoreductase [Bacillus aquiflavi]UAC49870.1 SDR family oxidoreductase [Bacillus aquiflavi]